MFAATLLSFLFYVIAINMRASAPHAKNVACVEINKWIMELNWNAILSVVVHALERGFIPIKSCQRGA